MDQQVTGILTDEDMVQTAKYKIMEILDTYLMLLQQPTTF